MGDNCEFVGVCEHGELAVVVLEKVHVDDSGNRPLGLVRTGSHVLAVGGDDGRATIVFALLVGADAVGSGNVTLILDCTGMNEGAPGSVTADGPVGGVEDAVEVIVVTCPEGVAQVIADLQQETYAAKVDDDALRST